MRKCTVSTQMKKQNECYVFVFWYGTSHNFMSWQIPCQEKLLIDTQKLNIIPDRYSTIYFKKLFKIIILDDVIKQIYVACIFKSSFLKGLPHYL
jgi:hypothetical protein